MRGSAVRFAVFLSIVITIALGLHGYAWARLVHDPGWGAAIELAGTLALAALALLLPATMIVIRRVPRSVQVPLGWIAFGWLGALFYVDVLLVPLDLLRLVAPISARTIAAIAGLGTLALVAAGGVRALRGPILRRVTVPITDLPEALVGFRIVQLTDVHVGPTIGRSFVRRLVERTNALAPDLVAITGDLVDGTVEQLAPEVEPLRDLRATHGAAFVTGNHEYFSGARAWSEHVRSLGIRVLSNEHATLEHEGARLVVAGVEDAIADRMGGRSDLDRALRDRDEHAPVILLAHQPRGIDRAASAGVALQISGHTHGGQMRPFDALVRLDQPFLRGLHKVGATWIWVSEGTGWWGPPLRIGTRSEITLLTLARA